MSKNRRKKATLDPALFALLVLMTISLGATGVFYVVMKNRQLSVVRKMEKVERQVSEHQRDVTNLEIRLSQLENRWELRNCLASGQSQLVGIPIEVIEDIPSLGSLPELARNK